MRFLRRNWTILLAGALIPLVIFLAFLQQRWIGEMGERERGRLRQGLYASVGEFAAAVQREILLAPLAFAPPPRPEEGRDAGRDGRAGPYGQALATGDWTVIAERYAGWKNLAVDPGLLRSIHLAVEGGRRGILRWDGGAFVRETDGESLAAVQAVLGAKPAPTKEGGFFRVGEDEWNLAPAPGEPGLLILFRYDLGFLERTILPRLAELHIGAMTDYYFRILDRRTGRVLYSSDSKGGALAGDFSKPDLHIGLFRQGFGGPDFPAVFAQVTRQSGSASFFLVRARSGLGERPPEPSAPDEQEGEALWTIEAVHRNGSLASVVRASTFRNAAASLGILLLLSAAIVILALANRRNQALVSAQEEFVATVTHELKTPLAVISSAAANLADGIVRDGEGLSRYGSAIGLETRRLVAMIDKLLLYTRLGSEKAVRSATFDVAALLRSVLEERRGELEELGFRIEAAFPEEPLEVEGDPAALGLALGNLVSNILVHAASGKYIGVFARREAGRRGGRPESRALLRIDDRGPGIPRGERKLVFEAFYRGRRARENQEPGSGIGLNLARRVVAAHGGSLSLESDEGFGTSLTILLPLARTGTGRG